MPEVTYFNIVQKPLKLGSLQINTPVFKSKKRKSITNYSVYLVFNWLKKMWRFLFKYIYVFLHTFTDFALRGLNKMIIIFRFFFFKKS